MTYYKAIRPDGTSFFDDTFRWATEPGGVTTHPYFVPGDSDAMSYLSVSTTPTDCTGMRWPCRLLEVEPVDPDGVFTPDPDGLPNKRAAGAWRTVRELPATDALSPQGEHVVALIERAKTLTATESDGLYAAWGAARYAAKDAAGYAAWYAAWDAARYAAWGAAWGAAWYAAWDAVGYAAKGAAEALTLRDLIGTGDWTQEAYDELTRPWRTIVGKIHPDDEDL